MAHTRQGENSNKPQGETVRGSRRQVQVSSLSPQHSSGRVEALQQTLGNQGVLRRMEAGLRISDVNDPSEREADRVAQAVMISPNEKTAPPAVATSPGPAVQRKCAACEEEEEKVQVQRKESSPTSAPVAAPPIVNQVLASPGEQMDPGTRSFMESRFGHDFGRVRVHTDAEAAESAQAINARAYTVGSDLVFAPRNYSPDTGEGRWVLAHELAHVIQQERGGAPPRFNPDNPLEQAAEEASATVMQGENPVRVRGASATGLARLPADADIPVSLPQDQDVTKLTAEQRQNLIQTIDKRLQYLDRAKKAAVPQSEISIPGLAVESPEAERARLLDWRKKLEAGSGTLVAFGIARSTAVPQQTTQTPAATAPAADTKVTAQRGSHTTPAVKSRLDMESKEMEAAVRNYYGGEQSKSGSAGTRSIPQAHASPPPYLAPKAQPHTLEDTIAAANKDPHQQKGGESTKRLETLPSSPKEMEAAKATFFGGKPREVTLPDGRKVMIPPRPSSEITEDIKFGDSTIASANVQGVRADVVRTLNSELKDIEEGPGLNREVITNLRKAHEAIRNGDLEAAVELTKLARSARRLGVAAMSDSDRLVEAVKRAIRKFPGQTGERFKELLTPEAIAGMVAFTGVYIVSQLTPAGWVADVIAAGLLLATLYMLGEEAVAIIQNLADFASIATSAKTESDIDEAADHLAIALTKIEVDVILAILLHKAGKAAKPYVKPSPYSGAVADMVTRDGKPVRVPVDSVPESGAADVVEPTRLPDAGDIKSRRPRGFETGRATPGRNVKPGTLEGLEKNRPAPGPRTKPVTRAQQLEAIDPLRRTQAQIARQEFDTKFRSVWAEKLRVGKGGVVDHARELQVLDRYPGVYTQDELNAFKNMRGIPAEYNDSLHLGALREERTQLYEGLDKLIEERGLVPGTPEYNSTVRNAIEKSVLVLDDRYGHFFTDYGVSLKER